MFTVKVVDFDHESETDIRAIRDTVFICEQGISRDIEFDGLDGVAMHALVSADGQSVGTGRMLDDGHIGRIAILSAHRGQGLGSMIVQSLIDTAVEKGYQRVYLGSQTHAIKFYTKLGFVPFGDEFMEAGIPHLSMEKSLV